MAENKVDPWTYMEIAKHVTAAQHHIEQARNEIIQAMQTRGITKEGHAKLDKIGKILWANKVNVEDSGDGMALNLRQILLDIARE